MGEPLRRVQTPAARLTVVGLRRVEVWARRAEKMFFSHTFLRWGRFHSSSLHPSWIPRFKAGKRVWSWMCDPQNPSEVNSLPR